MTAPSGGLRSPSGGRPRVGDVVLYARVPRSLADWLDGQIDGLEHPSGGRSAVVRKILENARLDEYFPKTLEQRKRNP